MIDADRTAGVERFKVPSTLQPVSALNYISPAVDGVLRVTPRR